MGINTLRGRAAAVLVACMCTAFAAFSIRYSYGVLLPEMLSPLSMTKAQAGAIYAAYFAINCLMSPFIGIVADRCNLRILITAFVMLMGVGTLFMQYATTVIQASVFFAIAGMGAAACWAPVMVIAQRWTGDSIRGTVLSLVDAGSSLGVMAAGTLIPLFVAGSGWQSGWSFLGLMAVTVGAVNFICIRNRPRQAPDCSAAAYDHCRVSDEPGISYSSLFSNRLFWNIALAYLFNGFAIIIPFTFLNTYACKELAMPYETAGFLITLTGIGGLVGKLTLGPLSDTFGRAVILLVCAALVTAGALGMAYSTGVALQVVTFLFGVGYGACWGMYAACASDYFSKKSVGAILGTWSLYLGIGSFVAPIVSGWAADRSGTLQSAFIVAACGGVASLLLLLPLLKTEKQGVHRAVTPKTTKNYLERS